MPKIARKTQKILGGSSADNGQFGSAQAGTKILSNDPAVIQALPAWDNGWNSATVSGLQLPTLEEMQGIQFVQTYQLAYLFQEGVPEYDAGTTYYHYSVVKKASTFQLFGSLVDNNVGNALTDPTKWVLLFDLGKLNNYTATTNPTVNDDSTDGYGVGSFWLNQTSGGVYVCFDATPGAAVWRNPASPEIADNLFRIVGSSDATKKVAFEVDGLTTATTRTVTVPNKDGTMAMLSDLVPGYRNMQIFTSSGTFTPAAGVTRVFVEVWGGGGGGGGQNNGPGNGSAPGGGGGGYSCGFVDVTPSSGHTVTVGTGGAGGTSAPTTGSTGGTSSFAGASVTVQATGGAGGVGASSYNVSYLGGAGGVGSNGTLNLQGENGDNAVTNSSVGTYLGGNGGASPRGGQGGRNTFQAFGTKGTGNPGLAPGGGASGAMGSTGSGNAGGTGADGRVVVYYP